jgi:type I restriction enzyme, S subunit
MKNNWQIKKLNEICCKASSSISQNQLNDEVGVYPIYGASGFIKNISFYHQKKEYISIVKDGAGIGRISLLPAKSSVIGTLQYLIPREGLNIKFLYYILNSFDFLKYRNGATIPHIYFREYSEEKFLIPPLPEQHRIVKILDETFEKIEKTKENVVKNLKNTKEFFESYLQSIFASPKKDWAEKRLGEILEIERGGSPRPIQKYLTTDNNGINWIKIGDTKNIDKYIKKTRQKIKPEGLKKSRLVNPGDFILSNSMSFGRPYIMKITGAIHDGWLVLREKNENVINKDYLYSILSSPYVFNQFDTLAAGSTVRNLNITLVSSVKIPLPSVVEQKSIVAKLDNLSVETKKLEIIYKQKLADLEELKKSILKKAFSGEL